MPELGAALVLAAILQAGDVLPPVDDAELEPPRTKSQDQAAINRCYDSSARRMGAEGRTTVVVRIDPEGSVSDMKLEAGIVPWQEAMARCVISHMSFTPGTRNGVPVASELTLPIVFSLDYGVGTSGELDYPKLATTSDEAEQAYRACYPPDELTTGKPKYRVTINSRGKTTKIELIESTGLEWLDSAGRCILERLKFEPARIGKSPVDATMTIPLVLRPPK